MNDLSKIAGTLKYGAFDGRKRNKLLIICAVINAVMILGLAGVITALCIDQANRAVPIPATELVFAIIGITIGFLLLPAAFSGLLIRNEKIKKQIFL